MLQIEITHDKNRGYVIDVVTDKNIRDFGTSITENHVDVIDLIERVLDDYRHG